MSLPLKGKILALDLGTCRTGVSISDVDQKIAFLRDEIEHHSTEELLLFLKTLIQKEEEIVGILVGLPLHLSGVSSKQTERVLNQVEKIKSLKLPIQMIDERWSTEEAREPGIKVVDSRAAQILLENFLSKPSKLLSQAKLSLQEIPTSRPRRWRGG